MFNLKPDVVARLERVLSSVEMLLPKAVAPIDWEHCHGGKLAPSLVLRVS